MSNDSKNRSKQKAPATKSNESTKRKPPTVVPGSNERTKSVDSTRKGISTPKSNNKTKSSESTKPGTNPKSKSNQKPKSQESKRADTTKKAKSNTKVTRDYSNEPAVRKPLTPRSNTNTKSSESTTYEGAKKKRSVPKTLSMDSTCEGTTTRKPPTPKQRSNESTKRKCENLFRKFRSVRTPRNATKTKSSESARNEPSKLKVPSATKTPVVQSSASHLHITTNASPDQPSPVLPKEDSEDIIDVAGSDKHIVITRNGMKFELGRLLSRGAFSELRKGTMTDDRGRKWDVAVKYTMYDLKSKVENANSLCNELKFMMAFQQFYRDKKGSEQVLPFFDGGRSKSLIYVVYPLCGPNLNDLRKTMDAEFSLPTALRLCYQVANAVEVMDDIEMIHGRVQPSHFIIGGSDSSSVLFLVSMGRIGPKREDKRDWCRDYRYSPRETKRRPHWECELDCMLLTMLDIVARDKLPWFGRKLSMDDIKSWKRVILFDPEVLTLPTEFYNVIRAGTYPISTKHAIKSIKIILLQMCKKLNVKMDSLFEWEHSKDYKRNTAKIDAINEQVDYLTNVASIKKSIKKNLEDYDAANYPRGIGQSKDDQTTSQAAPPPPPEEDLVKEHTKEARATQSSQH